MPDGHRPTHPQIRQRLNRVLKALQDPAAAKAGREKAAARRRLAAELTEDGMGILALHLPAEQVVAVADRIEQLARSLPQAGDERNLGQLRADLAAEALLRHQYGPCPAHGIPAIDDPRSMTASSREPNEQSADPGVCRCAPVAPLGHRQHARHVITAPGRCGGGWPWTT
jgi:hypothetical protein